MNIDDMPDLVSPAVIQLGLDLHQLGYSVFGNNSKSIIDFELRRSNRTKKKKKLRGL